MTTHDDTTGFTPHNPHEEEARQRWGHTDAYKQSQKRVAKMTKADWDRIGAEAAGINNDLAALMDKAPSDPAVQAVVARHFAWLRNFYEPGLEMYRGLGSMYADDPRFAANYDGVKPGLAAFMRDAMHAYCDLQSARKQA